MRKIIQKCALLSLLLTVLGCASLVAVGTNSPSGSFVLTALESNSILLVEGVAGTHLVGETVEVFNSGGGKVAEIGRVDNNGKFSGRVGPPNPFRVGDTVIIRIGPDVGSNTASQPSGEGE